MKRPELVPGTEGTATVVVGEEHLASRLASLPGESYPPVFATAQMIALMEVASARAMAAVLGPDEQTAGVTVDVRHTAATPCGATVRATGRYVARDGGSYLFEVTACDDGGEIGRGTHRRVIVTSERLLAGAHRRVPISR